MTDVNEVDKLLNQNNLDRGPVLMDVVLHPNELLKQKSSLFLGSVVHDQSLQDLMNNMVHTMMSCRAMGLAAVQVGRLVRVLVFMDGNTPVKMVNPTIVKEEGSQYTAEGCLSLPLVYTRIRRPQTITVNFQNELGLQISAEYSEESARVVKHEIDHLDGVMFLDHMNFAQRESVLKKFKRAKKKMGQMFGG
jgi:peptide deformylase